MKEQKAVAILMANLKGAKNKRSDLLTFAEATRTLLNNTKRWGIKEMSKYFGTSQYMIRQIDKINDLDDKLQKLILKDNLGIETSYHLWRIEKSKDHGLNVAVEAERLFKDMKSDEVRTFVHFMLKNPSLSISQCKELSDKIHPDKIRILALPLDESDYEQLITNAKKKKLKLHEYVMNEILGVTKHGKN